MKYLIFIYNKYFIFIFKNSKICDYHPHFKTFKINMLCQPNYEHIFVFDH